MNMSDYNDIVGFVEQVSIPELGVNKVLAKIDSGAFSGAVHCELIETFERDGERWLRCQPISRDNKVIETKDFQTTYVRSASGHRSVRYVVPVTIHVRGNDYTVKIGLSLRNKLKFPILIGRRFLRENNLLVDVRINQEYDSDGARTS